MGDSFRSGKITPYPAENAVEKTLSLFWKARKIPTYGNQLGLVWNPSFRK